MKKSKIIIESGISKSEKMKIVKAMRNNSFLNYRDDLEKHGMKVEFETSPYSYYKITHRKWGKRSDGKERAIYITSKRNAGDDAEYISNDNVAMGELNEASAKDEDSACINQWKRYDWDYTTYLQDGGRAPEEPPPPPRGSKCEKFAKSINKGLQQSRSLYAMYESAGDLKVGDEVLFNGKYKGLVKQIHTSGKLKGMIDVIKKGRSSVTTVHASYVKKVNESVVEAKQPDLSKYQTKTLRDLYKVLYGKANTAKEKAGVEKIRAELVKRKVIKKEELKEEMHDCIQDYQGMGYSYSEAVKKCKGSVWDEKGGKKGGKKGKRFKRESKEDTMKITKSRLKEIIREELDSEIEWNAFKTGYTKLVDELANDYTKASSILISSIKKINRQTHDDWDDSKAAQHDKGRRAAFKIHGQMYDKYIKYFRNFSDGALKNLFYDTDLRPWDLQNLSRKAFDIDLKPQYTSILIDKWSPKMRDLRKKVAADKAKRGLKEIESYNHAYEFEWTLGNMIRFYDAFHEDFSKISGLQSITPGVFTIFKAGSSHFARNKNFNAKKQESLAIDKIKKHCDTLNTRVKNKVAQMLTKIEKEIAKAKKDAENETRQTESHKLKITKSRLKEIIREELVEFKSFPKSSKALKGKDIVWRIKNSTDKGYKTFFGKKTLDTIAKKSKLTAKELDELLPDSVPGNLIYNLWNEDEVNG